MAATRATEARCRPPRPPFVTCCRLEPLPGITSYCGGRLPFYRGVPTEQRFLIVSRVIAESFGGVCVCVAASMHVCLWCVGGAAAAGRGGCHPTAPAHELCSGGTPPAPSQQHVILSRQHAHPSFECHLCSMLAALCCSGSPLSICAALGSSPGLLARCSAFRVSSCSLESSFSCAM